MANRHEDSKHDKISMPFKARLERVGPREMVHPGDVIRLPPNVNALGFVPVETTARGITAVADLERVKAILEDQPISPLSNSKH